MLIRIREGKGCLGGFDIFPHTKMPIYLIVYYDFRYFRLITKEN